MRRRKVWGSRQTGPPTLTAVAIICMQKGALPCQRHTNTKRSALVDKKLGFPAAVAANRICLDLVIGSRATNDEAARGNCQRNKPIERTELVDDGPSEAAAAAAGGRRRKFSAT